MLISNPSRLLDSRQKDDSEILAVVISVDDAEFVREARKRGVLTGLYAF